MKAAILLFRLAGINEGSAISFIVINITANTTIGIVRICRGLHMQNNNLLEKTTMYGCGFMYLTFAHGRVLLMVGVVTNHLGSTS